jgi:hypothetical protein
MDHVPCSPMSTLGFPPEKEGLQSLCAIRAWRFHSRIRCNASPRVQYLILIEAHIQDFVELAGKRIDSCAGFASQWRNTTGSGRKITGGCIFNQVETLNRIGLKNIRGRADHQYNTWGMCHTLEAVRSPFPQHPVFGLYPCLLGAVKAPAA